MPRRRPVRFRDPLDEGGRRRRPSRGCGRQPSAHDAHDRPLRAASPHGHRTGRGRGRRHPAADHRRSGRPGRGRPALLPGRPHRRGRRSPGPPEGLRRHQDRGVHRKAGEGRAGRARPLRHRSGGVGPPAVRPSGGHVPPRLGSVGIRQAAAARLRPARGVGDRIGGVAGVGPRGPRHGGGATAAGRGPVRGRYPGRGGRPPGRVTAAGGPVRPQQRLAVGSLRSHPDPGRSSRRTGIRDVGAPGDGVAGRGHRRILRAGRRTGSRVPRSPRCAGVVEEEHDGAGPGPLCDHADERPPSSWASWPWATGRITATSTGSC